MKLKLNKKQKRKVMIKINKKGYYIQQKRST